MSSVAFHEVEPGRAASLRVLPRALDGEVFVLRRLMQAAGVHDRLVAASRAGIARSGCDTAAWTASGAGFEQLHRFVPAGEIPKVTTAVKDAVHEIYLDLMARLLRDGLGFDRPIYAMTHPIARFIPPYDATGGHRVEYQRFGEQRGHGKVTVLPPHRDSWFNDPPGSINIWVAVGPVRAGNGLSIYPEVYRQPLDFVRREGVTPTQAVGVPVNFDLDPGDVVVFEADHLHASELNRTGETRHVMSLRVLWSRSGLALRSTDRFRSFHPSRPFFARVVAPASRRVSRMLGRRSAWRVEGPATRSFWGGTPPRALRALSDDRCAVELADGTRRVFPRRCPHQGGDLALGHLRNGSIVCPWHNLPFDLATGRSPCESIPPLRVTS